MLTQTSHSTVLSIHGPVISSSDLGAHLSLFEAFGLREVGRIRRSEQETGTIWQTTGQSSEEITLETPGTAFGLRLVRFSPGTDVQIRQPSRGSDSEALKVIDFYTPDLDAARAAIEAAGFRFKDEVAEYETPEGRFREAHLWGPDGVVCALLGGDPDYFSNFATVTDRLVSEPQSISGPVQDPTAVLLFLEDVLGLEVIHRYGLDDQSFDALVGSDTSMKLRAWNVGLTTKEPYFGIINYGLPEGSQTSVFDIARPPSRGLLGATLIVDDAARIAIKAGVTAASITVPGMGDCLSATFQGPNGAWFQALQPTPAK